MTHCTIGAKVSLSTNEEDGAIESRSLFPFHGQIGPVYLFNDAITPELVQCVYLLGPSYMYSFLDHETAPFSNNQLPSGILDVKDGLASKVVFGLNAQVIYSAFKEFLLPSVICALTNSMVLAFFVRLVMARDCLMHQQCWIMHWIGTYLKRL